MLGISERSFRPAGQARDDRQYDLVVLHHRIPPSRERLLIQIKAPGDQSTIITHAELVGGLRPEGRAMAVGYHVTKTAGTQTGRSVLGVHVVRDEGNGNAEMVRIACPDKAEQDRIAAELVELLNELVPKP